MAKKKILKWVKASGGAMLTLLNHGGIGGKGVLATRGGGAHRCPGESPLWKKNLLL